MSDRQKVKYVCRHCGSEHVGGDTWAWWDKANQVWECGEIYDKGGTCEDCDGETRLDEVAIDWLPPLPQMIEVAKREGYSIRTTDFAAGHATAFYFNDGSGGDDTTLYVTAELAWLAAYLDRTEHDDHDDYSPRKVAEAMGYTIKQEAIVGADGKWGWITKDAVSFQHYATEAEAVAAALRDSVA